MTKELENNNRNTRKNCEICSKLTVKTQERRQWTSKCLVGRESITSSSLKIIFNKKLKFSKMFTETVWYDPKQPQFFPLGSYDTVKHPSVKWLFQYGVEEESFKTDDNSRQSWTCFLCCLVILYVFTYLWFVELDLYTE